MSTSRKSKFGETLGKIIKSQSFNKTKKKIADDLEISDGLLSQYINNKSSPSFESLIKLANYFDVTLDYLVFGEDLTDPRIADYGHIYHYIDKNLVDLQSKIDNQTWMVNRVSRVLYHKMKETVIETLSDSALEAVPSGVLKDSEVLEIEPYSLETKIITNNLQYDMIDENTPGRFMEIVARNLSQKRGYQFILPERHPHGKEWTEIVASYLRLLKNEVDNDQVLNDYCEFKVAQTPLLIGCGIYKLDIDALRTEKPLLFSMMERFIHRSFIGYVIPTNSQFHANPLMDTEILELCLEGFAEYWRNGDLVGKR